jgi:hypothetical protein
LACLRAVFYKFCSTVEPADGISFAQCPVRRPEMNVKLLVGIVLFVIGLATAVMGISNVADRDATDQPSVMVEGNQGQNVTDAAGSMILPFIAAVSLAVGGLLIGISVGNWKNPRTNLKPGDEVVNPEGYHKMKHV